MRQRKHLVLSQAPYNIRVLKILYMNHSKPCETPPVRENTAAVGYLPIEDSGQYKEAIGALLYLSQRTHPDIADSVRMLAKYI